MATTLNPVSSGALSLTAIANHGFEGGYIDYHNLSFNANSSNSIYTDNGLILPSSISKQSYIIYK
jgi:hypothetical protein